MYMGKKKLTEKDLMYAAYALCPCGAGLAYEKCKGSNHYWDCSAILLGEAKTLDEPGYVQHTGQLPFIFYEILSEIQPSAKGATTRPSKEE
jgi:hypothetical protein